MNVQETTYIFTKYWHIFIKHTYIVLPFIANILVFSISQREEIFLTKIALQNA